MSHKFEVVGTIPEDVKIRLIQIGRSNNCREKWELFTVDEFQNVKPMDLGVALEKSIALSLAQEIQEFVDNTTEFMSRVKLFAEELVSRREEEWNTDE